MIKDGTNPYFVKELDAGYVVIGDKINPAITILVQSLHGRI